MRRSAPSETFRLDRLAASAVREERLRSASDRLGDGGMTAWRGLSGRRYVATVYPVGSGEIEDMEGVVLLAVRRGRGGVATLIDSAVVEPAENRLQRSRWLSLVCVRGATEIHAHLLAAGPAERVRVQTDLSFDRLASLRA